MTPAPEIIVYYWDGSPWASKVVNYLNLRGLPYSVCVQPITMPRPDLAALGVNYRRIPVVSIGKDVYVDTLLILEKLELIFPTEGKRASLSMKKPEQKALEKLLEKWTDAVVFSKAADCIPLEHPLVKDPTFIKDRTELWGESWEYDFRVAKRPEGLVQCRAFFDFLESSLLSDGREWILDTKEPMLADIHSAWIFNWMIGLEGSFPKDIISEVIFPKTFAWCWRYDNAMAVAAKAATPSTVQIEEVLKRLAEAPFAESTMQVDSRDPTGLSHGQHVSVSPSDTGFSAQDIGPLLAVNEHEVVVGSKTKDGTETHIHAPRWNFTIKEVQTNGK